MKGPKKSKNLLFIAIAAVVLVIAVIAGVMVYSNSPAQRVKKQLSLGHRYLSELRYEEAVDAFTDALEIDPNHPDAKEALVSAYLTWSDALAEAGDTDGAFDVLQRGLDQTGDARLSDKIAVLKKQTADGEKGSRGKDKKQQPADINEAWKAFEELYREYYHECESIYTGESLVCYRTFDEMAADYEPMISTLEAYTDALEQDSEEKPNPAVFMEHDRYPLPIGEPLDLQTSYVLLAHFYCRIGQMEECMSVRRKLASYLSDDLILQDHELVNPFTGTKQRFDQYGRITAASFLDDTGEYVETFSYGERGYAYTGMKFGGDDAYYHEMTYENGRLVYYKTWQGSDGPGHDEEYSYQGDEVNVTLISQWIGNNEPPINHNVIYKKCTVNQYGYHTGEWIDLRH